VIVWREEALLQLRAAMAGVLHVMRHASRVTRHTSHVTRHTSHVTRHAGGCMRFITSEEELMALAAAVLRGEPRSVYTRPPPPAPS